MEFELQTQKQRTDLIPLWSLLLGDHEGYPGADLDQYRTIRNATEPGGLVDVTALCKDRTVETITITQHLPVPGRFWTFNREERNAVAVLVGLLTRPGNLESFAALLEWQPPDLDDAELSVEWTFLRDLWNYHSRARDNDQLRSAIVDCLQPSNPQWLRECSVLDFNTYFGAVPKPSATYIQSPGNWSISRFAASIPDADEFRRTCRFKWAFNIKPDLVVQTPAGHVLCIEAKWDSGEGSYPSNEAEKAIFRERTLKYVSQTDVQRYLVDEILGLTGSYAYLARSHIATDAGRSITWAQLLPILDRSGTPQFIQDWCDQEINQSTPR